MKRNEFKLLMEDWKKNFAVEGEVVSSTLNEGYTESDRAILEEGIKDMPIVKTAMRFGLSLAAATLLYKAGLLGQTLQNIQQNLPGFEFSLPDEDQDSYDPAKQEFFRLGDNYRNDFDKNDQAQNLVAQMEEAWENSNLEDYRKTQWFVDNASEYVEELAELCTVEDLEAIDDEDKKNYLQGVDLGQIDRDQAYLQATFYLAEKFISKSGYNRAVDEYLKLNKTK